MTETDQAPLQRAEAMLWCLHILGPDDVIPAPSKAYAERAAAMFNKWAADRETKRHEFDPVVSAVAEPWPYSAESHAEKVAEFIPNYILPQWQITAAQALESKGAAVAWIRYCSDGTYEGPIHDSQIDDIRRRSGVWIPLTPIAVAERAAATGNAVLSEALLSLEARLMEIQPIPEDQPKQDRLSADLRASAQISRCSEQREASLLAENAALRRHLQAIADQGPNFGPDGTFATWRHWADLAKDAIAQIPART